jgi:hypothetical protein
MIGKAKNSSIKTKFKKKKSKNVFHRLYSTRPHKPDVLITKSEKPQKKKKKFK